MEAGLAGTGAAPAAAPAAPASSAKAGVAMPAAAKLMADHDLAATMGGLRARCRLGEAGHGNHDDRQAGGKQNAPIGSQSLLAKFPAPITSIRSTGSVTRPWRSEG